MHMYNDTRVKKVGGTYQYATVPYDEDDIDSSTATVVASAELDDEADEVRDWRATVREGSLAPSSLRSV
eukprot:JP448206.1.p3 GENE.JP448206.1~~JP448206.1.p3  ORF type:complete len:69 (-),score=9.45 JP448206.1:52-258(-)